MLTNYLKIAWRHLLKDRSFTFLNLAGLSTGLACAILIWLWVSDERQVDKFFQRDSQLFQVLHNPPAADGTVFTIEHTPGILAGALKQEMPEVEDAASVIGHPSVDKGSGIVSTDATHLKAQEIFATPNFFSIFSYTLLRGSREQVLAGKYNVVLSRDLAARLFPSISDPIGKTISWERADRFGAKLNGLYTVAGVFDPPPANASFHFDIVFNYEINYEKNVQNLDNWGSSNPSTYLILKKGTDIERFNARIKNFMRDKWKAINGEKGLQWVGTLFAQRYSDKYLHNNYVNGAPSGGRIEYVRLFTLVAAFILLIACINFMNLSTAKASRRIKEVGIRKVVGAGRSSLVLQYLGESLFMAFFSLLLALALVGVLLPAFRQITGKELHLPWNIGWISTMLVITTITGLLAGSYPAFYLSGFRPVRVLKGKFTSSLAELWVRKGLVVFQFTLSVTLIISVWVVYRQMKFIQTRDLGYNRDHVVQFPADGNLQKNIDAFLTQLKGIPGVADATTMNGDMLGSHSGGGGIQWEGKDPNAGIEFTGLYVGYDFTGTMGLHMTQGRSFIPGYGVDSTGIIFNESAIAVMHLKDPIGKIVYTWGNKRQIIGVVKDFNMESLYSKVGPSFLIHSFNNSNIVARIRTGMEKETLSRMAAVYRQFNPGLSLDYHFIDDDYQVLYAAEQRLGILSRWFAGIAIFISCLGLFGLAAFTASRRQKEIGIRKVIGATVTGVVLLLSKDFLRLVAISVLIAFPLAGWLMTRWLDSFAYRINMDATPFILAGLATLGIALLTISFQSIRAAIANPVKALRAE